MLDFIEPDLVLGLISGLAINLIPVVNRRLDKATSSYAGRIVFFIVEVVEAFEDGKVTKEEVNRAIARLKEIVEELESNEKN